MSGTVLSVGLDKIGGKMKTLCWLLGGYPSISENERILEAYVKGGCDGIEWSIPVADPYREQAHLKPWALKAFENCPDFSEHLNSIEKFRKKYPSIEIYPGIYMEMTLVVGIDNIIGFFKKNNIDTIFLVGTYSQDLIDIYKNSGLKIAKSSVSYYLRDEEISNAKDGTGFIYLQALPYESEIKAGYTSERLRECVALLKKECPGRPIYCAKGIRKMEDLRIIKEAGADGYILGSILADYYGDLGKLEEVIKAYKNYAESI